MTTRSVRFDGATLEYHGRRIWCDLSVAFEPARSSPSSGPNGSGKTSLLRVILGPDAAVGGRVEVLGAPPRRGNPGIGYVPQHHTFDRDLPLRGRDLVRLGRRRPPLGLRPARRRDRRPVSRRDRGGRGHGLRRRRRSGASRAASSSACGSPRRSSATRACCSATSRWRASTCTTSRRSPSSSAAGSGGPAAPSCS